VPRTATWQPTGTPVSEDYTSASGYFNDKIAWAPLDTGADDHADSSRCLRGAAMDRFSVAVSEMADGAEDQPPATIEPLTWGLSWSG
jgi:hypothetical protein